jgi:hypothetical protein
MHTQASALLKYYFLQLFFDVLWCAGLDNFVKGPHLQHACICGEIVVYFIMHAYANTLLKYVEK